MAKRTEKPISKNSPEAIANEKPIRIDWNEASKNHPILSSIAIPVGSYMAGKNILDGLASIVNAGTGTYTDTNKPADFTTDVLNGTKKIATGLLYGACTIGTIGAMYLLSKDN